MRSNQAGATATVAKALTRPEYAKYLDVDADGLVYVQQLKEEHRNQVKRETYVPPNKIVGSFGIKDAKGHEILLHWSINGLRRDKRHGTIDKPIGISRHSKVCLEAMFKGW